MRTYQETISRLDAELRDEEAWPNDISKIDEQINLLYQAALAIGRSIPLARLSLVESAALTATLASGAGCNWYDLTEVNVFTDRYAPEIGIRDMGIASIRIDSEDFSPDLGIEVPVILSISKQPYQQSRKFFAIDYENSRLYVSNPDTDVKLYHAVKFIKPTNEEPDDADDYKVLDFPLLDDNDTQRAIHIVAAHVSGVTIKDPAGAQFQALLEQTYAG